MLGLILGTDQQSALACVRGMADQGQPVGSVNDLDTVQRASFTL